MNSRIWGATALLAALVTSPALAQPVTQPSAFSYCDGYGAPSKAGDGMTSQAWSLGIFVPAPTNGTTLRTNGHLSDFGLTSCDQALVKLPEKYWLRKVNLIQARAVHRLSGGDVTGALADLDLARAAAKEPDDAFLQRSLFLDADFIRAYALRKSDRAAGEALAGRTWAQRPYNRETGYAALAAIGDGSQSPEFSRVLRGLALIEPKVSVYLFWRLMEERRFAEAAAVFPIELPRRVEGAEPVLMDDAGELRMRRYGFLEDGAGVSSAAAYAYALAALGRSDDARLVLNAAKARMDWLKDGGSQRSQAYGQIAMQREAGGLKELTELINLRLLVNEGKVAQALDIMRAQPTPMTPIAVDLIEAILAKLPPDYAAAAPALADFKMRLKPNWADRADDLEDLFNSLPDAETDERVAKFGRKANFFFGDGNAYDVKKQDDGTVKVSYRGLEASGAVVEEFAMLHAAYLTRKAGKKGFIVIDRLDTQHSVTNTMYGVPLATFHNGYGAELYLMFVDPDALPAGYEKAGWRVIDADEVYRSLGPIYGAPVQAAAR